jgi:hypothetical protein
MSQAYHVLPSELLHATGNEYQRFCLDRAVWYFGTSIESDMDAAEEQKEKELGKRSSPDQLKIARQRVFDAYMNTTSEVQKGQFADPVAAIKANQARR